MNTRSPQHRVSVFAPATVANLGVGFDILGMALDAPGDVVTAEFRHEPGVELVEIAGDAHQLSIDPARNTAGIAARETLTRLGVESGVRLWLDKGLPLASGLGSSAASAAAAAVAVNTLYGAPLSLPDLLAACIEAEAAVSGRHADNVAPALWGGIVLVTGQDARSIYPLPVPDRLRLALVTPDVAIPTVQARAVLPPTVPLCAMVAQTGLVAALIHALYTDDLYLLADTMQREDIITPARAPLIPCFDEARAVAVRAGALAAVISGAGPTICAICDSDDTAARVSAAFSDLYTAMGIAHQARTARPSPVGAAVLQATT